MDFEDLIVINPVFGGKGDSLLGLFCESSSIDVEDVANLIEEEVNNGRQMKEVTERIQTTFSIKLYQEELSFCSENYVRFVLKAFAIEFQLYFQWISNLVPLEFRFIFHWKYPRIPLEF